MPDAKKEYTELLGQMRATNAMLFDLMQKQFDVKQADAITRLAKAGVPNAEIALIVGTSLNTVQVTVSRGKKKSK
jgi:DNA-directed RNA polymerase specialized sigma24 family protein